MAVIAHLAWLRLTSNLIYQAIFSGNNDLIKVALLDASLYKS
jgi:hypothetical protein